MNSIRRCFPFKLLFIQRNLTLFKIELFFIKLFSDLTSKCNCLLFIRYCTSLVVQFFNTIVSFEFASVLRYIRNIAPVSGPVTTFFNIRKILKSLFPYPITVSYFQFDRCHFRIFISKVWNHGIAFHNWNTNKSYHFTLEWEDRCFWELRDIQHQRCLNTIKSIQQPKERGRESDDTETFVCKSAFFFSNNELISDWRDDE